MSVKGFYVSMVDEKNSYIKNGVKQKICVKCSDAKEQNSIYEIANHYKSDFSRVTISSYKATIHSKIECVDMIYTEFIEFCLREIEWLK